jgi:hypothetical protein
VWDDVLAWEELYGQPWDGTVIAANDIGAHWPRELHHWVTLHPQKLIVWRALRAAQKLPLTPVPTTWGREMSMGRESTLTDKQVPAWAAGSSGMLAVQVACVIGCTRAVLCGIPMTMTPHFGETEEKFHKEWLSANGHWRAWTRNSYLMQGWARSMSGRTREMLSAPTRAWMFGESPD